MRHLQPLIDQFVEDVLNLVRRATIEDLRGLVRADRDRERPKVRIALPRELSPRALPQRDAPRRRAARRGVSGSPSTEAPRPAAAAWNTPSPVAEITDPESLLAAIALEPPVVVTPDPPPILERQPEVDRDGPPSAVRPVHQISPVRLMGNETLARVSSAGVVIRRGRRA